MLHRRLTNLSGLFPAGTSDTKRNGVPRNAADEEEDGGTVVVTPVRWYLSGCQIAVVVLAVLATVLSVAMLAGGYKAILNSALREVRGINVPAPPFFLTC